MRVEQLRETDERYMAVALEEAFAALGLTHPNPAVGAVIVHDGKIVARGRTQPAGHAHAEVMALRAFASTGITPDASTTLYVTLEPCSTQGRTGPCTEAIVAAGIANVVMGAIDPNPAHAGRALDILMHAGVTVRHGVMAEACEELNPAFNFWMRQQRTMVAAKVATTLDGRIATRGGQSKWITGAGARADVHRWRAAFPAIAVGVGTVRTDDPALNIRREGTDAICPQRFVFDRNLVCEQIPESRVFTDDWRDQTTIVSFAAKADRVAALQRKFGWNFWLLDDEPHDNGIGEFLQRCSAAGITGVYLEGGAQLLSSFLKQRAIDYLFHYRAPKLLADNNALSPFFGFDPGDMSRAIRLTRVRHQSFGDDQLMRGDVVYPAG